MSDQEIRARLRRKLGNISPQAVSNRAKALRKKLPMNAADALYVLAHRNGIDIGRHLDPETLARVSGYVSQLGGRTAVAATKGPRASAPRQVRLEIAVTNAAAVPGFTPTQLKEVERMAKKVYPTLYVFENSARGVISLVLHSNIGPDWWEQVAPAPLKKNVSDRQAAEDRDAWHSKRGAHPIYYTDLTDLPSVVRHAKAWPHFKVLFPSQSWFEGIVDDLNVSRRVIAHMNPITAEDVKHVESGFAKWAKQLTTRRHLLP
jgi:hypothetical protein